MNQITQILIDILATALSTTLIYLINSGVKYLKTRTHSEKVQLALQEFQNVLTDGVAYVEQTVVRLAKEGNYWDSETQMQALDTCKDYILNNLTDTTFTLLTEDKEDIDEWIRCKIEATLNYQH